MIPSGQNLMADKQSSPSTIPMERSIVKSTTHTGASKLKFRVDTLEVPARKKVLNKALDFFAEFMLLKSDEFEIDKLFGVTPRQYKYSEISNIPSASITREVVDAYHNQLKPINKILEEKKSLTVFEVIASLCKCAIEAPKGFVGMLDLSRAIEFMGIDEYTLVAIIDALEMRETFDMHQLVCEFMLLPSHAILVLTAIRTEISNPRMATLFHDALSNPEEKYTEEEYKKCHEDFTQFFTEYQKQQEQEFEKEFAWKEAVFSDTENLRKSLSTRFSYMEKMEHEIHELHKMMANRPTLSIEAAALSSSSSSDIETDEIQIFSRKVNVGKWLSCDLDQNILNDELERLHQSPGELCYVRFSKLKVQQMPATIFGSKDQIYLLCTFMQYNNGNYIVRYSNAQNNSKAELLEVRAEDVAFGHSPKEFACPEGTRVLAMPKVPEVRSKMVFNFDPDKIDSLPFLFSGTVAVRPLTQNKFEYLVFFDNNVDAYVDVNDIRVMLLQPKDPSDGNFNPRFAHLILDSNNPCRAQFIQRYLYAYPDWPLLKLKKSENTQRVLVLRKGLKESAFVLDVDRQLALLRFPPKSGRAGCSCVDIRCRNLQHEHTNEWVYRGNSDIFPSLPQASFYQQKSFSQFSQSTSQHSEPRIRRGQNAQFEFAYPIASGNLQESISSKQSAKKQKQTARKTTSYTGRLSPNNRLMQVNSTKRSTADALLEQKIKHSEKVHFIELKVPKWRHKLKPHKKCSSKCVEWANSIKNPYLAKEEYKIRSPYFTPLLHGWSRLIYLNKQITARTVKINKHICYKTPCGLRFMKMNQIAQYLKDTKTENLTIDMFSFSKEINPEILATAPTSSPVICPDFSQGMEAVPIPAVNAVDDSPIPNMIYRARRMAHINDPKIETSIGREFCTGCTCTDGCSNPARCECQKLTFEANSRLFKSIQMNNNNVGYKFRQLKDRHLTGIYECNDNCPCTKSCYNRVVQNPLRIPLQLFKTAEKGWGVRSLVDLPEGIFVCTYSGELLRDSVADDIGKEHEHGDMYFANMDLVEQVEQEKEQQGIDYIDADDGFEEGKSNADEQQQNSGQQNNEGNEEDPDLGIGILAAFDEDVLDPDTQREILRIAELKADLEAKAASRNDELPSLFLDELMEGVKENDEDEKSSQLNLDQLIREKRDKWRLPELNAYFGDYDLFVMNAARTGNIGRFFNHSCEPNMIIQQVFVDSHDLRLPWLAFFTFEPVRAGEELSWDYQYQIGTVADRRIDCKCGSQLCRGRLL